MNEPISPIQTCNPIPLKLRVTEIEESQHAFNKLMTIVRKEFPTAPIELIMSSSRKTEAVVVRMVVMCMLKYVYGNSITLKGIGKMFHGMWGNGCDHSTVLHAFQTISDLRDSDKAFRYKLEAVKKEVDKHFRDGKMIEEVSPVKSWEVTVV